MSKAGGRLMPAFIVGLVALGHAAPGAAAREWSSPVEVPAAPNERSPSDVLRLPDGSVVVAASWAGIEQAFVVSGLQSGPYSGVRLGSGFNIGMTLLPTGPDGLMVRGEWYRDEADQTYKAKLLVSSARTPHDAAVLTASMDSHDDIGDAFAAALAPDGRVAVVWRQKGGPLWLAERAPGATQFGASQPLPAGPAQAPSLALGRDGALLVSSADRVVVRASTETPLINATLDERPYSFATPVVAIDDGGRGVIGYRTDGTGVLTVRPVDLSTGATGAEQLPPAAPGATRHRLALTADGGGRVVATLSEDGVAKVLTRARSAGVFTPSATLSSPGWTLYGLVPALDYATGEGFFAVNESLGGPSVIRVADRGADGSITSVRDVATNVGSHPVVSFHAGRGLIAWRSRNAAGTGDGGARVTLTGVGDATTASGSGEVPSGPQDPTPADGTGSGSGGGDAAQPGAGGGGGQPTAQPQPQSQPLPSTSATRALVLKQAAATAAVVQDAGIRTLVAKGYRHPYAADQAGTLSEQVLLVGRRARPAAAKSVVIAAGSARFAAAGTATVVVKPVRAARKLLRGRRTVRVAVRTVFRPSSGAAPISTSRVVLLRFGGS